MSKIIRLRALALSLSSAVIFPFTAVLSATTAVADTWQPFAQALGSLV